MRAHQTHVHSWRGQSGGLNEERALHSLHSNCSSTRSLGSVLKLVAKEDTTKANNLWEKVFPKSGGGPGKVWRRSVPKSTGRFGNV